MKSLIDELRQLRIQSGMSQNEMANLLEVSRSLYALVETGRRNPSGDFEEKIIRRFPALAGNELEQLLREPPVTYRSSRLGERSLASLLGDVDNGEDVVISFAGRHYRILPVKSATDRALDELCGTWEDGRTPDELIQFLQESRSRVRNAVEL